MANSEQRALGRTVVIKTLRGDYAAHTAEHVLREAWATGALEHPNIVPIYSVDESNGIVYFVMACVDGVNLARKLHEQGRLSVADTRRILKDVGEALAYAPARGVIHRDIKPENVVLDAAGRPHLVDFGAIQARLLAPDQMASTAVGTLGYVPMEQIMGQARPASDLYALAMTLLVAMTHAAPANGRYCRLAVGRDYLDACPVRGVRRGGGAEQMRVAVSIGASQQ